jgi:hypothetical protein
VVHRVRVLADGREAGVITVDTAQRPNDVYDRLRTSHRTTPPPMSDTLPATGAGALPPVWLVGRERAENVVLQDARTQGDALVAELRVPAAHPSMFDHAQDHVPGPVLMEAARQASLLLAADHQGLSPSSFHLDYVSAEYLRFAELDSPILVVTRRMPDPVDGGRWTEVSFDQDGVSVARMRVRLGSTLPAGGDDAL